MDWITEHIKYYVWKYKTYSYSVEFLWRKGHYNSYGNEICDNLAKIGGSLGENISDSNTRLLSFITNNSPSDIEHIIFTCLLLQQKKM